MLHISSSSGWNRLKVQILCSRYGSRNVFFLLVLLQDYAIGCDSRFRGFSLKQVEMIARSWQLRLSRASKNSGFTLGILLGSWKVPSVFLVALREYWVTNSPGCFPINYQVFGEILPTAPDIIYFAKKVNSKRLKEQINFINQVYSYSY